MQLTLEQKHNLTRELASVLKQYQLHRTLEVPATLIARLIVQNLDNMIDFKIDGDILKEREK
jgi:competence CoiA-like predicted nuclease